MSGVIDSLERAQLRSVPAFAAGDRVRVHFQVIEGTRRRTQVFEGVVLKRQGSGARETFTVRKQSFGVGVERTFPLHSPKIEQIEIASHGDVRRAKLYYLRGRVGRRARVRERQYVRGDATVLVEAPVDDEAPLLDDSGAQDDAVPADTAPDDAAPADAAPADAAPADAAPAQPQPDADGESADPDGESADPDGESAEPPVDGDAATVEGDETSARPA